MQDFEYWCRDVLHCVRFHPDHAAIRKELEAHYEDRVADLERIGYPAEEACPKALTAMGDAREVGEGLDRAHSPALGRLAVQQRIVDHRQRAILQQMHIQLRAVTGIHSRMEGGQGIFGNTFPMETPVGILPALQRLPAGMSLPAAHGKIIGDQQQEHKQG